MPNLRVPNIDSGPSGPPVIHNNDAPIEALPLPDRPALEPQSPQDDTLELPDSRSKLEDLYSVASKVDPQRAAEVVGISNRLNTPEDFTDRHLDELKKTVDAPQTSFFKELENDYPETAKHLSIPQNMAVAHDDMENLSFPERAVKHVTNAWDFEKSAFESGALQEELAFLQYGKVDATSQNQGDYFRLGSGIATQGGAPTDNADARIEHISKRLEELSKTKPEGFNLARGLYGATEFAPQIIGGLGYGAKFGIPAAGAASVATSVLGPGAAIGGGAAFTVGMTAGEIDYNFKLMTGLTYDSVSKLKDANGQPLPENIKKITALSVGAATAGLSFVKLNAVLDTIPGGKEFLAKFSSSVTEKILEDPKTMSTALKGFAQNYVKSVAHGVAAMEGITATSIAGTELAKRASGQPFQLMSPGEIAGEMGSTAKDAALTFGTLGLPGTASQLSHDLFQAHKAEQAKEFLGAINDNAGSSKVKERMPEAYSSLLANVSKDSPVENVHIPVEAFDEYFQKNGIDPGKVGQELGVANSYVEAKSTGGDVQIPLSTWADKMVGTGHEKALLDDVKFSQDALTVNESKKKVEETKAAMLASDKKTKDAIPAEQSPIHENIKEQLKTAGFDDNTASAYAHLNDSVFTTLADRTGKNPVELFDKYGLKINREGQEIKDENVFTQSEAASGFAKGNEIKVGSELPKEIKVTRGKERHQTIDIAGKQNDVIARAEAITEKGEYKNGHTGSVIRVSENTISKAVDQALNVIQKKKGRLVERAKDHIEALQLMPEIIKNAVLLTEKPEEKGRKYGNWKYYFAPVEMNGKDRLIKLEVKETAEGNVLHNYALVDAAKGRLSPDKGVNQAEPGSSIATSSSISDSAMNLSDFVNQIKPARDKYSFFQGGNENTRGRIRFGNDRQFNIDLLKTADRSTFLHEMGHFYLEVHGDLAKEAGASADIVNDHKIIRDWLGAKEGEKLTTDQHEKFARGFEAYLREGNAPSVELRNTFAKFKDWLVQIYQSLTHLNVELTPEVKDVMDRMVATKEQIEHAKLEMGYIDSEIQVAAPEARAQVKTLQDRARAKAEETLLKEQMKSLKDNQKEQVAKETERLKTVATEQIKNQPIFQAIDSIKEAVGKRRNVDELAHKLLDGKLKDEDAVHFEMNAELHGFASGEDLAKQIIITNEHKLFDSQVKSFVDNGLKENDISQSPERLRDEALKAVHTDQMTELLALEQQILMGMVENKELSARKRLEARIEASTIKANAIELLEGKSSKDASNFQKYITAERNAAMRVTKALDKKDYSAASTAKREQAFNHALAQEAMKIKAEVNKTVDYLHDLGKRGQDLLKAPYGFVRQVDALLMRHGLAEKRTEDYATFTRIAGEMSAKGESSSDIANVTGLMEDGKGGWRPEGIADFVSRVNDNYYSIDLPYSVLSSSEKGYKDLTVGELRDLKDGAKTIMGIGKGYNSYLSLFGKLDIKKAAKELKTSIESTIGAPYAESFKIGSKDGSALSKVVNAITSLPDTIIPDLVNLLTLTHYLDGGKETGPAKEYIYRPLKEAEDRKLSRYETMTKKVNDLMTKYFTPKELSGYKEKREFIPEFGRHMNREELLSLALNWGNEGNRDRVRDGYGLSDQQIHQVLGRLTKKEWDFAQGVWDHLQTYWPEIVKLEMDVNGVEPKGVDPASIDTVHGTYKGGYYPIAYDFDKSSDALRNAEQKNALYKQFSASRAQTDSGHAQARAGYVKRPVRLDLGVLFNHLENVVHDLEYRKAVIDVNKFLFQPDVKSSIENAVGLKGYKSIGEALKFVASDQSEYLTNGDKIFRWFRFGATFSTLAYRGYTLPMDLTGNAVNGVWEIGPTRFASAMTEFAKSPEDTKNFVESKSERMRYRSTLRDRDIMDIAKKWSGRESAVKKYGFLVQALADEAVSFPLWNEIYKRNLDVHGEEKAIHIADETVAMTIGSGSKIDQVGAQRGNEFKKATSMYYSWMSMMFNRMWLSGKMAGLEYNEGNMGKAIGIMAKATFFGWGLQAAQETFWRELFRNNQQDDEEAKKKRIFSRMAQQPFGYVWLLRDIAGYFIDKSLGQKNVNFKMSPIEQAAQNLIDPAAQAANIAFSTGKHFDEKFSESAARGAAQVFGYPQQANNLAFNFLDWMQNNGELTWRDFLTRKTKK